MLRKKLFGKKRKGQSTVEYVILVAAVLVVIIWFLTGTSSPFKQAYNAALNQGAQGMQDIANSLARSHYNGT
jgi:uncharacterized protein (UPF0333 family)